VACCIRSLLWRIRPDVNVKPVPPPVRKINSKSAAFSMRGVPVIAAVPRDGSRLLRFLADAPNTDPESGTTCLARAEDNIDVRPRESTNAVNRPTQPNSSLRSLKAPDDCVAAVTIGDPV
jgi:hypothetical protein